MESELQEQRVPGTLCGEQADLGSPHLLPGRERGEPWAQEVNTQGCAENSILDNGLHPTLENSDSEKKLCTYFLEPPTATSAGQWDSLADSKTEALEGTYQITKLSSFYVLRERDRPRETENIP